MQVNSNGFVYPAINNEDVKGFRVLRSPTDQKKYNVFAVDEFGVPLVPMFTELDHEKALHMCQVLNTPYDDVELVQYNIEEVQMPDGSSRFYQVQV